MISLLARITLVYPDSLTVVPEPRELDVLWEGGFIDLYDSWPNGDRRWTATQAGLVWLEEMKSRCDV